MVRLKIGFALLLANVAGTVLAASALEEVYQRGMAGYENGQWPLAIQEFEAILRGGYEAEQLYYNLGNAYFRTGEVAGAVWAYEKALMLNPNDADARYNLVLVNLRVKDRIELPEQPWVMRIYRGIRGSFTRSEWVRLVSLLLLLAGALHAAGRVLQLAALRRAVWPGIVVASLLAIVALDAILTTGRSKEGIVYGELVTVTSAPSARSTELFQLHEGLKVAILDEREEWRQVELLDGKSGWLPADQLRPL